MNMLVRILLLPAVVGLLACGGGGGGTSKPSVTVTISPIQATVSTNDTLHFSRTVVSSTSDTSVIWSCTGGSINADGNYTAPSTAGTYTVTIASGANSDSRATATVVVLNRPRVAAFSLDNPQIWLGDSTTLRWTVEHAETVTLQPGGQVLPAQGSMAVTPKAGITYTLVAATRATTVSATAALDVRTAGQWVLGSDQPAAGAFTRLADGRLLMVRAGQSPLLYDPTTGDLSSTTSPSGYPFSSGMAGPFTLPDTRVLVLGADGNPIFYTPSTDTWARGAAATPGSLLSGLSLSDGKVLASTYGNSAWTWGVYDPLADTWTVVPTPGNDFSPNLPAVTLADGRLLLVGSELPYRNTFAFYAFTPATRTWAAVTVTGLPAWSKPEACAFQMLDNGSILMVGLEDNNDHRSAYLVNPATWVATRTGDAQVSRVRGALVAKLTDGRVLLAGGRGMLSGWGDPSNPNATTEIYDPATGVFTRSQDFEYPTEFGSSLTLADGRVFTLLGSRIYYFNPSVRPPAAPDPGVLTTTGNLVVSRKNATLIRLSDGKILATGGTISTGFSTKAVERFDPVTGTWTRLGDMLTPRSQHAIAPLADGRLLMVGGGGTYGTSSEPFAEMYDPATGTSVAHTYQDFGFHVAGGGRLPDGRILFLSSNGGVGYGTLVVDPTGETFTPGTAFSATNHYQGACTQLPSGDFLLTGGGTYAGGPNLEILRQNDLSWETKLVDGRISQATGIAPLPGGRYLLTGCSLVLDPATWTLAQTGSTRGYSIFGPLVPISGGRAMSFGYALYENRILVFDPALGDGFGGWFPGPTLPGNLDQSRAMSLADGRVLLVIAFGQCLIYTP